MNDDLRLKSIKICNPEKLSNEELMKVMTQIYKLPPEELRKEEGKDVLAFLRRVNTELNLRAKKNPFFKI
jgi:hypothetical protein